MFLHKDGAVKLGDMVSCKAIITNRTCRRWRRRGCCTRRRARRTTRGSNYKLSPEVWKDQPYDQKSDIWSLGCVLYEVCALKPPFRAEDMEGLYKKVVRGLYPKIPSHFSQDLCNVIRALLQV